MGSKISSRRGGCHARCQLPDSAVEEGSSEHVKIRNLDTGEMQDAQDMFFDVWQETSRLPWAKLWQDYRRSTEQLFEAALTGKAAVVRSLLLRNESDEGQEVYPLTTEVRGLYGRTALHVAASAGQVEAAEALLSLGAHIDAQTDAGFTALHLACRQGHMELVDLLVQNGCDLVLQADQGETALHLAAMHGRPQVVTHLLGNAPDLYHIRNNYGQRPREVSLDAATAMAFQHESLGSITSLASSSSSNQSCEAIDGYGGRSLWNEAGVLRRNSRHDAVQRLLQGDSPAPAPPKRGAVAAALPRPVETKRVAIQRRFTKLQDKKDGEPDGNVGPKSFRILSVLGRGSFGEVFQVTQKTTGQIYAMKVLRKNKIIGRNLMRYALTERNLLSYIRHPFIVRLHHAFQTPSCLVLVLQYCPGGNLSALLQREGHLPEALSKLYTAEVLLALEHLHERNVVYRDLKPENVVLDDEAHAVLTDFGLSKEGVDALYGTKSFCGSVAYLAPEILTRQGHGRTVDLYGLGVLLYEIMEGQPPYYSRDRDTLFRNIVQASLSAAFHHCSSRGQELILALMQRDPTKRLGKNRTSDVRTHVFFRGLDFEKVLRREVQVPPIRHWSTSFSMLREEKVTNPFEGRLGSRFRSWSSQEIRGWDFSLIAEPDDNIPRLNSRSSQPERRRCST